MNNKKNKTNPKRTTSSCQQRKLVVVRMLRVEHDVMENWAIGIYKTPIIIIQIIQIIQISSWLSDQESLINVCLVSKR